MKECDNNNQYGIAVNKLLHASTSYIEKNSNSKNI